MSSNDTETGKPDRFSALCQTRGDQDLADLARGSGLSEAAADAVAAIDAVMAKVRRSVQRRDFGRLILARIDPSLEVSHLDAIIALSAGAGDTPQDEVTVGIIAERMGIDPPAPAASLPISSSAATPSASHRNSMPGAFASNSPQGASAW